MNLICNAISELIGYILYNLYDKIIIDNIEI